MAGYTILRAVSFNDQVMNIIFLKLAEPFEIESVGMVQNEFKLALMWVWLADLTTDWRAENLRHPSTNNMAPQSLQALPDRLGVSFRGTYDWSHRMVWWGCGPFKRQLETNHSTWGNHCMPFRNKLFLCCLCDSMAPGTRRPNIVRRSSDLWYLKSSLQKELGGHLGAC